MAADATCVPARTLVEHLRIAKKLVCWQTQMVPDFLQTPAYARAVIAASANVPAAIGAHAGLRGSFTQLTFDKHESLVYMEKENSILSKQIPDYAPTSAAGFRSPYAPRGTLDDEVVRLRSNFRNGVKHLAVRLA